jgi:hypothetical protein
MIFLYGILQPRTSDLFGHMGMIQRMVLSGRRRLTDAALVDQSPRSQGGLCDRLARRLSEFPLSFYENESFRAGRIVPVLVHDRSGLAHFDFQRTREVRKAIFVNWTLINWRHSALSSFGIGCPRRSRPNPWSKVCHSQSRPTDIPL